MQKTSISDFCCEAVDKVVYAADKTVEQGKQLLETAALQKRLASAQRQLGALVYSLSKRGEENTLLVSRYIESISEIEQRLAKIKAKAAPDFAQQSFTACPACGAKCKKTAVFCPSCGKHI